ncbi:hypothetical protein [Actinomadura hibisca]|uniref:hypothetical protein n=1 Tax=Actinomadura hibisca TaxID=68565 RepID=UPI0008343483|nr:hypothetical protein [Actinomadura hibisca]
MTQWHRFEKKQGDRVLWWRIRQEGIRCFMQWGHGTERAHGSTSMTLDDERMAARHLQRKVRERERKGYADAGVETVKPRRSPGPPLEGREPVAGREGVYVQHFPFEGGPGPFRDYLVMCGDGHALTLIVKDPGYDADAMSTLLDFLEPRCDLAFDGRSHHKVALPEPILGFTHALFCSPALAGGVYAGQGVGKVFPIFDCEIAGTDTEVLVEARIRGRDSLPFSTWDREPHPVRDFRYEIASASGEPFGYTGRTVLRDPKFKAYGRPVMLAERLDLLPLATPDSWLEIRSHRGATRTVTPADHTPALAAELETFLRE